MKDSIEQQKQEQEQEQEGGRMFGLLPDKKKAGPPNIFSKIQAPMKPP